MQNIAARVRPPRQKTTSLAFLLYAAMQRAGGEVYTIGCCLSPGNLWMNDGVRLLHAPKQQSLNLNGEAPGV